MLLCVFRVYTVTRVRVCKETCIHAHVRNLCVFSRVRGVRDKNTRKYTRVAKARVDFVVYTCVVHTCHV